MAMEETEFWSLIARAHEENDLNEGQPDDVVNELQIILEDLTDEKVAAFQQQMLAQYCKAFDYRIIGAAYVIIGEKCDEDDQHGFRGWLISQGEEFYRRTLTDPDSLADATIARKFLYLPDMISLGAEVYEASTGELPPADPEFTLPSEPAGDEFKLSELPSRLPNLCAEWGYAFEEEDTDEPDDLIAATLAQVNSQVTKADEEAASESDQ